VWFGLGLGVAQFGGDGGDGRGDLVGRVDVVVANPPYVPTSLRGRLPVEVSHDPAEALFGGEDGLDVIRVVHSVARRLLAPGGLVAMEHDQSHAEQVRGIFSDGFCHPFCLLYGHSSSLQWAFQLVAASSDDHHQG